MSDTNEISKECLVHYDNRHIQVRLDFLGLCSYNRKQFEERRKEEPNQECMAKILRVLETLTNHAKAEWQIKALKAKEKGLNVPGEPKEYPLELTNGVVIELLYFTFGESTVRNSLDYLVEIGYIGHYQERRNSNPLYWLILPKMQNLLKEQAEKELSAHDFKPSTSQGLKSYTKRPKSNPKPVKSNPETPISDTPGFESTDNNITNKDNTTEKDKEESIAANIDTSTFASPHVDAARAQFSLTGAIFFLRKRGYTIEPFAQRKDVFTLQYPSGKTVHISAENIVAEADAVVLGESFDAALSSSPPSEIDEPLIAPSLSFQERAAGIAAMRDEGDMQEQCETLQATFSGLVESGVLPPHEAGGDSTRLQESEGDIDAQPYRTDSLYSGGDSLRGIPALEFDTHTQDTSQTGQGQIAEGDTPHANHPHSHPSDSSSLPPGLEGAHYQGQDGTLQASTEGERALVEGAITDENILQVLHGASLLDHHSLHPSNGHLQVDSPGIAGSADPPGVDCVTHGGTGGSRTGAENVAGKGLGERGGQGELNQKGQKNGFPHNHHSRNHCSNNGHMGSQDTEKGLDDPENTRLSTALGNDTAKPRMDTDVSPLQGQAEAPLQADPITDISHGGSPVAVTLDKPPAVEPGYSARDTVPAAPVLQLAQAAPIASRGAEAGTMVNGASMTGTPPSQEAPVSPRTDVQSSGNEDERQEPQMHVLVVTHQFVSVEEWEQGKKDFLETLRAAWKTASPDFKQQFGDWHGYRKHYGARWLKANPKPADVLPPEVTRILEDWQALHKKVIPITKSDIDAAFMLAPCTPTKEELSMCRKWHFTTDDPKKPWYRRIGVSLMDVAKNWSKWQSTQEPPDAQSETAPKTASRILTKEELKRMPV